MTNKEDQETPIADDKKEEARQQLFATLDRAVQWRDDVLRSFKSYLVHNGIDFDEVTLELVVDPKDGGPLFVPCVVVEGKRFFYFPNEVVPEKQMAALLTLRGKVAAQ